MGPPNMAAGYGSPAPASARRLAIASLVCALLRLAAAAGGMLFGYSASVILPANRAPSAELELVSGVGFGMGLGGAPSLALSVPAVTTGSLARGRLKRSGAVGASRPMALVGLVLGYLEIAAPVLTIALSFALYIVSSSIY